MVIQQQRSFNFVHAKDELGLLINDRANQLFTTLKKLDTSNLKIEDSFKDYFIKHHLGARLFFSLQNSAGIIHESVKLSRKQPAEINLVDYGAGLGTLYMLAGMLGFRRVVYNDYLPDWKDTAASICTSLNIPVSAYVTGDIDAVLEYSETENFKFDIIASRNVIEHIYSLSSFFEQVHNHNPSAVIFSTTTANYHNPAMRLNHYMIHKKVEKQQYLPHRKKQIEALWPSIKTNELTELALITRGRAKEDFINAIEDFRNNKPVKPVPYLRSNTCLTDSGYWCEHLLTKEEYAAIVKDAGFKFKYTSGYWDTHYDSVPMNIIGKTMNQLIKSSGQKGYLFSPFVNIVAYN